MRRQDTQDTLITSCSFSEGYNLLPTITKMQAMWSVVKTIECMLIPVSMAPGSPTFKWRSRVGWIAAYWSLQSLLWSIGCQGGWGGWCGGGAARSRHLRAAGTPSSNCTHVSVGSVTAHVTCREHGSGLSQFQVQLASSRPAAQ